MTSVTVGVLTSDQIASLTGMNNIQAGNVSTEDDEENGCFQWFSSLWWSPMCLLNDDQGRATNEAKKGEDVKDMLSGRADANHASESDH